MILLTIVGVALLGFCCLILFLRRENVARVDGCTIKVRGMWEDAFVEYSEPCGRKFTFDAYWSRPKGGKVTLQIEFPAELSVILNETIRTQEAIERLAIPGTPGVWRQIPSTQKDEIRDRLSRAMTKLVIAHEFIRPQKFGWTSFEDGKEIYHG